MVINAAGVSYFHEFSPLSFNSEQADFLLKVNPFCWNHLSLFGWISFSPIYPFSTFTMHISFPTLPTSTSTYRTTSSQHAGLCHIRYAVFIHIHQNRNPGPHVQRAPALAFHYLPTVPASSSDGAACQVVHPYGSVGRVVEDHLSCSRGEVEACPCPCRPV